MEKTADEVKRLQSCINDLISVLALSAIWSGSESCQMVGTLLESLLAILRLDFACARLNDSIAGSPIEVVRLARRQHSPAQQQEVARALGRWLSGDKSASRFVIANPAGEGEVAIASFSLGLQDEVGVLVAGSRRADFPTDIELVLLRVAANQAAIGLQEARRSGDQKRVAESLERRVAERTSQLTTVNEELRRSQAYLAEAQRLSHTGSFGWRVSTGEILWSEETFRIFQYDRASKPSVELVLERIHPEDAAAVKDTVERASQDGKDFDLEHRLLMPDGSVKHVHIVAHAERDKWGDLEFVGAVMDISENKRAEEELRRSEAVAEQHLRLVVDTTPAMINSCRPDGHLDYVNKGWLDYFGFSLETALDRADVMKMSVPSDREVQGQNWQPVIHPEDLPGFKSSWNLTLASGKPGEHEARVRRFDGVYRWHLFRTVPLYDQSGKPVKWYASAFDIEDRKQAEEALRRSESYLAEAQRLSHTGSWAGAPGAIRYWSEECCRVLGFDPHQGPPQFETFLQRIHPDDQARTLQQLEQASRERTEFEFDYRIVHPGGEIRDIHAVGHPVFGPSGDLFEFVGTVIDVTERKRAEEALRRSEAYLAEAQKLTHTGSWACNVFTREMIHSSEEHSRLYGFDPERGTPSFEEFAQRIHPDDRARVMQGFQSASRAGKDFDAHFRAVLPDGTTKYLYGTGHPLFNPCGDVGEFVGIVMDVTERRRADQERERLREAHAELAHINRVTTMGELAASLAHEVNQPIAAASTNANTCLRWLAGDIPNIEEARAAAMRIVKDGKRAAEIIKRIRLLFKKGTPEREPVDVNEVVREMTVLLSGETARYSILVGTDLAPDLPQVMADRVQLQQVLMNLMLNGIDAMKNVDGTRELTIKSQRLENEQLMVSVSDTGAGLPVQQADQIFTAFFTTKPHGTGMGLSISRSIIESHGGHLRAGDNSPRGARFYFTLPSTAGAHE